jgi:flagellar P-ring protein precursor FlgI
MNILTPLANKGLKRASSRPTSRPGAHMVYFLAVLWAAVFATDAAHAARAKDIGAFYGVRDNLLTGAGLVVGLRRTGDSPRNEAAIRALATRLQGLGVSLSVDDILSRNVALVMVNATLGPEQRTGTRLDVIVGSTGDAASLEGGMLLTTPLLGPDGRVYAVAEGPLVLGGYGVSAFGSASMKNHVTTGWVVGGAVVEREVASTPDFASMDQVEYVLTKPDFTTATRLAEAINTAFGTPVAEPASSSTVALNIPADYKGKFAAFAARVETVEVQVDSAARVIVSERTGTVVVGADVKIAAVAVAHGGLTIEVRRNALVSQPAPFTNGTTAFAQTGLIEARELEGQLTLVEGVTIGELVAALNAMGVKPRDLIIILRAIQAAGALHAEVVPL